LNDLHRTVLENGRLAVKDLPHVTDATIREDPQGVEFLSVTFGCNVKATVTTACHLNHDPYDDDLVWSYTMDYNDGKIVGSLSRGDADALHDDCAEIGVAGID
jgi:hypothetical protein